MLHLTTPTSQLIVSCAAPPVRRRDASVLRVKRLFPICKSVCLKASSTLLKSKYSDHHRPCWRETLSRFRSSAAFSSWRGGTFIVLPLCVTLLTPAAGIVLTFPGESTDLKDAQWILPLVLRSASYSGENTLPYIIYVYRSVQSEHRCSKSNRITPH